MATYLSPAVFVNEIDLSALPAGATGIIPGFIGTANKGPLNELKLITNAQQYIDTYGSPFPESFLGYAVLAYLEEGNLAWVNRVGVECEEDQVEELADICIDTSGNREAGWGRIALFKGVDVGKICTREAGDNGFSFHDTDDGTFIEFNDALVNEVTYGPTDAILTFVGTDYTGSIDDEFIVLITSAPTDPASSSMDGAGYQVIRSSDGAEIDTGTITESGVPGTSEDIILSDGIVIQIVVTDGVLDTNDSFRFSVRPDNRTFAFDVWCNTGADFGPSNPTDVNTYQITGDYATAEDLAAAIDVIIGSSEDYQASAEDDDTVCFRTDVQGCAIQLIGTEAFALEIGQSLYVYDIPKSSVVGTEPETFDFSASNNIAKFQVTSGTGSTEFTATIPTGFNLPAATVASAINAAATVLGDTLVYAYPLTIPGGDVVLAVETTQDHQEDQLYLVANGSNVTTVRFAETVGILFPFTGAYRGFTDSRVVLPEGGNVTESSPLSCEEDPTSAQCAVDTDYYQNIVGFIVASSAGTWVDGYTVDLEQFQGDFTEPGRYTLKMYDNQDVIVLRLDDISFNPSDDRYIGKLVNPGEALSTPAGNDYINYINRPDYLNGDPDDTTGSDAYDDRMPAPMINREFSGQANGIPADPTYSTELDKAVIGNPALQTGIYAFADPERVDISLLATPGFTSGSVIQTAISVCTNRGDCLYIVDPPFGLNAQQVVDWHNGLLFTDLEVALDSSHGALYHPYVKVFDQFNGGEIYIPPTGHVMAVYARTDRVAETWFAPAGLRRGKLLTALGLETEHTRGARDLMYGLNNAVNPIVNFPQRGIHVWGQRTLQRLDSALDRVNVRMLLIYIKKALAGPNGLLNEYIFEQNDAITRRAVTTNVNNFMSDIASRRGVTAWKVICDDTNNTPARVDRNELHVALLIKPTRAIEFVVLNIAILRSDQSFSSEEVLAAVGVTTTA